MEELARMVAASMDRHGCDTSIDHRRLNWSPWFRCELDVDLLLVPGAPGILALAEDVGVLGMQSEAGCTTEVPSLGVAQRLSAAKSEPQSGRALAPEGTAVDAKTSATCRVLALFEIAETDDLGAAILHLFAPQSGHRDRLRSGRCFARFTPIADIDQRHAAAISLREWLTRSAASDDVPVVETGSAA
jgi:hypothetical protein